MVANGVGVIDEDYCGPADEVKIQLLNFTAAAVQVKKGDRLAQGLFIPVTRATWQESDDDLRTDPAADSGRQEGSSYVRGLPLARSANG